MSLKVSSGMKPKLEMSPAESWSKWEPSSSDRWDLQKAAHLGRRAAFALSARELKQLAGMDVGSAVEKILSPETDTKAEKSFESLLDSAAASNEYRKLAGAWCYRLAGTSLPLTEKLVVLWHGHFATSADKVKEVPLLRTQNELLRKFALGDFRELAQGISKDPAMLIYLDSVSNRKAHPNENYARELMELFCLGEGNYTEKDVQELARCFTGWEIKQERYRFNRFQHDSGKKMIFDKEGTFTGEQAVDLVIQHDAMPYFICKKLFKYFVSETLEPSRELLEPLAQTFRQSQFTLHVVVQQILASKFFYSTEAVGRKVRSPVDLAIGLLRGLEGTTNSIELSEWTERCGQGLLAPPNVKGWDGGKSWINSSTIVSRANMLHAVLHHESTKFGELNLIDYFKKQGWNDREEIVDRLTELFCPVTISTSTKRKLLEIVKSDKIENLDQARRLVYAFMTLPEMYLA